MHTAHCTLHTVHSPVPYQTKQGLSSILYTLLLGLRIEQRLIAREEASFLSSSANVLVQCSICSSVATVATVATITSTSSTTVLY